MSIVRKPSATVIKVRSGATYDPATFADFKHENFIECSAEYALANIQPMKLDFIPEPLIAIDTETYYTGVPNNSLPANVVRRWIQSGSKNIPNDFPFCISLSDGINSFIIYDTLENGFREFKKLQPLLMNRLIAKTGHNMDFDLHMLANARVNMCGRFYDTSHLSRLTRAHVFAHDLLGMATDASILGFPTEPMFENMLRDYKATHRITDYRQFPRELMTQYTGADTWNALWSFVAFYPRIAEYDIKRLFDTESQTMLVTFRMERTGVFIDENYEDVIIPELRNEADEAERKIYNTAGTSFNINSSKNLEAVLKALGYGRLINYGEPTEAMLMKGITQGNPSFDKHEMERLENAGVPLIADIQQYKKAEKLLNTFAIKLYDMRDATDTVHCNINTMEAKTGRFSISFPSMQNMPRRSDSRIRDAFIAKPGFKLYDFDFKAQESLIMTHFSRAPYLLDIVNAGGDIHKAIAAIIYDIPMSQVDKKLRDIAKSVEFAIVYGAGADKVSAMTGLTLEEARVAINTFMNKVPEVRMFIKTANKVIKEKGYIRTVLGRRVYAEPGKEYASVNYLCQGSGADSTKTRMVEIYKFTKANNFKTRMILQVHDSLLQEVADEEAEEIVPYLKWLQTERDLFRVTVNVDVAKCESTWRNKEELDVVAIRPPQEMLDKMNYYDIWSEGLL